MAPKKVRSETSGGGGGGGAAASAATGSGKGKKGQAAASVAEDDADSALFAQRSKFEWMDSFIILSLVRSFFRAGLRLFEAKQKKEEKPQAEGKRKAEKAEPDLPLKEALLHWAKEFKIPLGLVGIFVLTCLIIAGGEAFNSRGDDRPREAADDYYGVLGVPRDAETADVKRAYKTLAKRWHPDRNPNCSSCQDTFAKIAVAYETLSDDTKRSSYDESGGIATSELKSPRSVPLTRSNFDELVTFSNDVWIVQIFKPEDGSCAQFHPFWENQIQKHGQNLRFGRVDLTNDPGKWLPVKVRYLPMVLKFARHLGSPEIFPITAMHEMPQQLLKFVLKSFPNIGLPLGADKYALQSWLKWSTRRHKVLFAIPGKSEEERYKSHLVVRKLSARWSDIFEFRTAETAALHRLPKDAIPPKVLAALPPQAEAGGKASILFFPAGGLSPEDAAPKVTAVFDWPTEEEDIVLHLIRLAELARPALTAQSADLLCRSLAIRRVYCLVLVDPPDSSIARAVTELADSRSQYVREVEEIRATGGDVGEDEDNFIVPVLRLHRRHKCDPSVATCHAPKFHQVDRALGGAGAFLMDFDQGRIAPLRVLSSYRGIYPQIAYEDSLSWVDDVLHPFLSLPDCNEGLVQHLLRGLRGASWVGLMLQFLTALVLVELTAKAVLEQSWRWLLGTGGVAVVVMAQSSWFLRQAQGYLPGAVFTPTLLATAG